MLHSMCCMLWWPALPIASRTEASSFMGIIKLPLASCIRGQCFVGEEPVLLLCPSLSRSRQHLSDFAQIAPLLTPSSSGQLHLL